MNLLYFTEHNLRDRFFIQDFVFNFKFKEKTIVFHAPFGETLRDSRFVTKRISSLLSEAMVYNNFLMGDQRDSFVLNDKGILEMNPKAIHELLYTAQLLILGPLVKSREQVQIGDPIHMMQVARAELQAKEVLLFPSNPKSPLATNKPVIDRREEVDRLLGVYEEETDILELAYQLRPVRLVSPVNYSMEMKS
ncbi:MAG: hypothetical protein AAF587_23190 [Bacteroidota bacterium]